MKRILLATLVAISLNAQAQTELKAMLESKAYDNWYIGVNGGANTKTIHNKWLDNLNANAGVRVGRWFTPAFGIAIESNAYFGSKPMPSTGTIAQYINTSMAATINLSNWWFGYQGEPRFFEVIAVPALGMGHVLGNTSKVSQKLNDFTGKLALDFAFNVDKKKCVQLYLEPALLYSIYGNVTGSQDFNMNLNRSHFQLNVGLIYKFKNTNGTHNFKYAEPKVITDNAEIDRLNGRIAELMAENEQLKKRPTQTKHVEPRVIERVKTVLEPVVVFAQGSSYIQKMQYANIEKAAKYMKEHSDMNILITGYASTEGSAELNQKLSEARAEAVKHALITKYGIAPSRIEIAGKGATSELSAERAYNRVAVFSITE